MKIILASNNKNKLREFRNILEPLGYEVLSQSEAGVDIEAEETGTTFEENAAIKAKAAYDLTKLPVIADDSGLMVDALDGRPGVYSARYAEEGKRCTKLLGEMEGIPDEKRTAKFVCAIHYIDENGQSFGVTGTCEGKIGYGKRGTNGFGYDPIFMYGDKSFAELSAEEKNKVSHRAMALAEFEKIIKNGGEK
jgi:XTP/dITP diphosphohydrolase